MNRRGFLAALVGAPLVGLAAPLLSWPKPKLTGTVGSVYGVRVVTVDEIRDRITAYQEELARELAYRLDQHIRSSLVYGEGVRPAQWYGDESISFQNVPTTLTSKDLAEIWGGLK